MVAAQVGGSDTGTRIDPVSDTHSVWFLLASSRLVGLGETGGRRFGTGPMRSCERDARLRVEAGCAQVVSCGVPSCVSSSRIDGKSAPGPPVHVLWTGASGVTSDFRAAVPKRQ
jgi:hypothetical protein